MPNKVQCQATGDEEFLRGITYNHHSLMDFFLQRRRHVEEMITTPTQEFIESPRKEALHSRAFTSSIGVVKKGHHSCRLIKKRDMFLRRLVIFKAGFCLTPHCP